MGKKTPLSESRFLEIIPGALIWMTFALSIIMSFIKPLWVVYFIILFDLYWLLRVLYFIIFLVYSWRHYRAALRTTWLPRLKEDFPKKWRSVYHVIFLPTYKEEIGIIETTLDALIA